MEDYRKAKRNNKHWSKEELDFIQLYYGRVKTNSIGLAISRSDNAIFNKCKELNFRIQEHIYSKEPLTVSYKGQTHHLQCFRYKRNENGAKVDKTRSKRIKKPTPVKLSPMSAHRRKPELKAKKHSLKEQIEIVQEFQVPTDKKLTWIPEKRCWVYR